MYNVWLLSPGRPGKRRIDLLHLLNGARSSSRCGEPKGFLGIGNAFLKLVEVQEGFGLLRKEPCSRAWERWIVDVKSLVKQTHGLPGSPARRH